MSTARRRAVARIAPALREWTRRGAACRCVIPSLVWIRVDP